MSKLRDPQAVAAATGCPDEHVSAALPALINGLTEQGILDPYVLIGLLATIPVETAHLFTPVAEAFWLPNLARLRYYDTTDYGKVDPLSGQRYYGRGYIQRTWSTAYLNDGKALGVDLYHHPDLLLQPDIAARDAALFWKQKPGLMAACTQHNWHEVRRLVNGGTNGLGLFLDNVQTLLKLYASSPDA
jgi:putative chitinase